jgi:predicted nucleic acid-binding protein
MDARLRSGFRFENEVRTIIVDTGPLVALLSKDDQWHDWAVETAGRIAGPLCTCESVLAETFFLLSGVGNGCRTFAQFLRNPGFLILPWKIDNDRNAPLQLLEKYSDLPASLADACLIRMAEQSSDPLVWTIDDHFMVYRMHGTKRIPTIMPGKSR